MNEADYRECIKIAEAAVSNIEDSQLKIAAFQTILEHALNLKRQKQVDNSKEMAVLTTKSDIYVKPTQATQKLSLEQLTPLIFHVSENEFKIIADFKGDFIGKMKQIQYVMLYLYANKQLNNSSVCSSKTLIGDMKKTGFHSLPNLNVYLRSMPALVIVTTKKKKSENTYEITHTGLQVVKNLIQEIVTNGGVVVDEPSTLVNYRSKKRVRSNLSKQIMDLIHKSFFDAPKTIKELKIKLQENGLFYERSIIDEKVRRSFLGKFLRRVDQNGKWAYVKQ